MKLKQTTKGPRFFFSSHNQHKLDKKHAVTRRYFRLRLCGTSCLVMTRLRLLLVLLCPFFSTANNNDVELLNAVTDWIVDHGAYISDKVEVQHIAPGLSGLFATQDIDVGEVALQVPWHLILKPTLPKTGFCSAIWTVQKAISKPQDEQTPYERYLAARSRKHLPPFWSDEGQAMLRDLIGKDGLPTKPFDGIIQKWFFEECDVEDENALELPRMRDAIMLVMTRAEGPNAELLIPIYDLINHRNGDWFNTDPYFVEGEYYQLVAIRPIKAGEQLQNSYNQCPWCGIYSAPYKADLFVVTPHIFETYGFVELHPQRWIFPQARLLFDVDETKDDGEEIGIEIDFVVPPSERGVMFLKKEERRLKAFAFKNEHNRSPPEHELKAIWEYHSAALTAISSAIQCADEEQFSNQVWEMEENQWYRPVRETAGGNDEL